MSERAVQHKMSFCKMWWREIVNLGVHALAHTLYYEGHITTVGDGVASLYYIDWVAQQEIEDKVGPLNWSLYGNF